MSMNEFDGTAFVNNEAVLEVFYKKTHKDQFCCFCLSQEFIRGGEGRWESMCMGGSDNTGDGLASQPRGYRVPGQPLLNRHQVGGVSRSPDGLFAQQEGCPPRADQP